MVGPQENIAVVSIGPEDDMEETRLNILESVNHVNIGKGTIVLTICLVEHRMAISIMESAKIDVIAGINLPMLVKLASVRSTLTFRRQDQAKQAGQIYYDCFSNTWPGKVTEMLKRSP